MPHHFSVHLKRENPSSFLLIDVCVSKLDNGLMVLETAAPSFQLNESISTGLSKKRARWNLSSTPDCVSRWVTGVTPVSVVGISARSMVTC